MQVILKEIVNNTRLELNKSKHSLPLVELEKMAKIQAPPLDLETALHGNCIKLIAEVKKASPSRGIIRHDFNPVVIAKTYATNGAAGISVLTEARYFQGSLNHIKQIRDELRDRYTTTEKRFYL